MKIKKAPQIVQDEITKNLGFIDYADYVNCGGDGNLHIVKYLTPARLLGNQLVVSLDNEMKNGFGNVINETNLANIHTSDCFGAETRIYNKTDPALASYFVAEMDGEYFFIEWV